MTALPIICGRAIFQIVDHDVDETDGWLRNKAARWRPGVGWSSHDAGMPIDEFMRLVLDDLPGDTFAP